MNEYLITVIDLGGTAIFALTGAIKGIAHRLDLLGVVVLGCTVGIGGGIIRDAVIGLTPSYPKVTAEKVQIPDFA